MSVLAILQLIGCGDDAASTECTDDTPDFGDVAAFETCTTCHSSELDGDARQGAPADVNFDTRAAAEANGEKAAEEVEEGEMPPADSDISLTAAEKQELYDWAACL